MRSTAFLLDLGRCLGCQACVAACKTGNEVARGTQYIRISETTWGTFPNVHSFITNQRCAHCGEATCVTVCPTGALYKEDGLTRLDRENCSGCSYCVEACPYGIPEMAEDGRSSKCDGCADVVKAGGEPWCVKTCPANALMYGQRADILAEAQKRLAVLQSRFPKAQLYGEAEGLGLIMVLPDEPAAFDLPSEISTPASVNLWQEAVQPASVGLTGLSVAVTGIAAFIARRNHHKEMERLQQRQAKAAKSSSIIQQQESDHDH